MVLTDHSRQRDVILFGHNEQDYDEVMKNSFKTGMQVRTKIQKTVVTSSKTSTRFERECDRKRHLVTMKINCKGQPFPRHDIKIFPREEYSTMSSYSRVMKYNYDSEVRVPHVINITVVSSFTATTSSENESRRKRKLVELEIRGYLQFPRHDVKTAFPRVVYSTTKTIGGGKNRRFIEHFTKTFGLHNQQPMVVVMRSRSDIGFPLKWMKYPRAKRNEEVLPVIPAEKDDEDESEEYNEFEEEIAVMDVRRNPIWSKVLLEIAESEPENVAIPIEDLIEIPTLPAKKESAPGEVLIDEKIESVKRPPVVHAELPDFKILENL